ncbi:MAG TPA: ATP-binding protein [Gammaproteobacteria bacterium]|nr:ATP-binding protein [Gammaproteobacteria bacterium]
MQRLTLIPEDPWRVVNHDIKVMLNAAILTLELQNTKDPSHLDLLNMLHEIVLLSLDSLRNKKEPDRATKAKIIEDYKSTLATALKKAKALESDVIEKEDILSAIKSARAVADPSLPQAPALLGPLLNTKLQSHSNQLLKSENSWDLTFIPEHLKLALISGDQVNLLKSIIGNCIENACHYAGGSKIDIIIQSPDKDAFFEIIIKDNGPGISAEVLEDIRNSKEVTTDGNGIGLQGLTAKVKSMNDGEVIIDSFTEAAKHGTQFTWRLPKALVLEPTQPDAFVSTAEEYKESSEDKEKPYTVYFIDDNKSNRKLMEKMLTITRNKLNKDLKSLLLQNLNIEAIDTPDKLTKNFLGDPRKIAGIITDIGLGLDSNRNGLTEAKVLQPMILKGAVILTYSGETEEYVSTREDFSQEVISGHIMKGDAQTRAKLEDFLRAVINNLSAQLTETLPSKFSALKALSKSPEEICEQLGFPPAALTETLSGLDAGPPAVHSKDNENFMKPLTQPGMRLGGPVS